MVLDILEEDRRHWTLALVVVSPYPGLCQGTDLMMSPTTAFVSFNVDDVKISKQVY